MTAGWRVEVEAPARRDLHRLDRPVQMRVLDALERLAADPPVGDVIKLKGRPDHRLRVGDWRVILRLDSNQRTIHLLRDLPRRRAYER